MHQFCSGDLNKFVLLLRKGVYPYQYRIAGKNLMKLQYHLKTLITANLMKKVLAMKTLQTFNKYGKYLN